MKTREAVIRQIAEQRRVSIAVARTIYKLKPMALKQKLCARMERKLRNDE
jgi:hypothetical protein